MPGYEAFGGMWECPCIVNISGRDVLIFSPQYTKLPGRGEGTNHNVYLIGAMDYDTLTFTPDGPYRHLDYGFDFYAAQGAAIEPAAYDPGRAILIAWIGLPDNHYPTADEDADWEGSLSLPRELRIKDGRLVQTPLPALSQLRDQEIAPGGALPAACELEIACPGGDFDLNLFTRADGSGGLRLYYDAQRRVCRVDRSGMDRRFNTHLDEALDMPLDTPPEKLRVFVDRSSVEIFAGDGGATFTTHLYPTEGERFYTAGAGVTVKGWTMKKAVTDEFVI